MMKPKVFTLPSLLTLLVGVAGMPMENHARRPKRTKKQQKEQPQKPQKSSSSNNAEAGAQYKDDQATPRVEFVQESKNASQTDQEKIKTDAQNTKQSSKQGTQSEKTSPETAPVKENTQDATKQDDVQADPEKETKQAHDTSDDGATERTTPEDEQTLQHKQATSWDLNDPEELLAFDFDAADLQTLVSYIGDRFNLTFITADMLDPAPEKTSSPTGSKLTFSTHKPLAKRQVWSLFLSFLDMAGMTVVREPMARTYRIVSTDPKSPTSAQKKPLPAYIGVHPDILPEDDTYIRYIYFVKNASMDVVKNMMDWMKSSSSPALIPFQEMRALAITDKAYNIRSMLNVIRELDRTTMPETLSVIKLQKADASQVAQLYKTLTQDKQKGQSGLASRVLSPRQTETLEYFDAETRVIPEPRTNTLIVLGREDAVQKVETFIKKHVDKDVDMPYLPTHVYKLKHLKADAVMNVLNKVVTFKSNTEAGKTGSVRDGDKYFGNVSIISEPSGNRLIIRASYEDYLKLHETIEKIDIEQPQVAVQVLLLNVDINDTKELGVQMRNKKPGVDGLLSQEVNYQTSGLAGTKSVVENTQEQSGAKRLLGDLIALATGGSVGSSFITLGSDSFGVWGMLRLLQTYTHTTINQNPFVVTTNNYKVTFTSGEKRRVKTATTIGANGQETPSFEDISANLQLSLTPRISYEGYITLDVNIEDTSFTNRSSQSADRIKRNIDTSVIVRDKDVLALGGLIRDTHDDSGNRFPVLADMPLVGWLFKNKQNRTSKSSLMILISPEIIPAEETGVADKLTQTKIQKTKDDTYAGQTGRRTARQDPVHRWFFNEDASDTRETIDNFLKREGAYISPARKASSAGHKSANKRLSDYV